MLRYHTLPVTAFQQNASIVWCDETMDGAIIDPGGDTAALLAQARTLGGTSQNPEKSRSTEVVHHVNQRLTGDPRTKNEVLRSRLGVRLVALWLTHGHIDHVGGTAELASQLDLPIIGPHEGDRFWIDNLAEQSRAFGFPQVQPFTPDRWLNDGDTLTLGHCTVQVRHCPGHTPGHVVFHSAQAQRCFVGDVLFAGSIGRTDFPGGNQATLLDSITQRLWPMGDDTVFIPGHGPESTFGEERRFNPYVGQR